MFALALSASYYQLELAPRASVGPGRGGVLYQLANADQAEACLARRVAWDSLGLGDATLQRVKEAVGHQLLVRATVVRHSEHGITVDELVPTEAWLAQGPNAAAGRVVRIEDTGVRCIAFPCPWLREHELDSSLTTEIAALGWDASGASSDRIARALDQLPGAGLLVAGDRYTVTGPAGEGKARSVTQFWLRATDDASPKPGARP